MTQLKPGDTAPAFTLLDADQRPVSLADFAGGRVIVYFYPAAMTPGCTIQAVDFDGALSDLAKAGYQVVGISPDSPEKLARFREVEHLGFPLLADPDLEVLKAYAAYGSKTLYGKAIEGVLRSTFIIDVTTDGVGKVALAQYNVRAAGHVAKLRRDLGV
ncbi:MAG: thioredoxin-dependent thiol peroxidase [Propionibacteriaceae bacterium]|nr:thioredoxin-dependent thiol peroxidase [Propionibacteriaceae bacterium]